MAADGSIIIDTRIDTQGISKGTSNLESSFGKIGNAAKKIGSIIAAAFAVDQIVDFAKAAIELGSDLEEVQNVVDVTFETMNEDINEFAKNAAKTAGLSETMAKRYAGTFGAMADAFGFAEAEAYEMATALTQLSGDVASFYNITQDEAYTKLKSVFTGETESLKDLGVVMTQTALDAYAMANGFEKTTSKMTEQEKVALRYQFVMEQLNNAAGDFVRTSDSWANQTRVLSLQFESLKASIGEGLINVLTPALQYINSDVMPTLQSMADNFAVVSSELSANGLFSGLDLGPLADSARNLGKSFGDLAVTIGEGLAWAWENVLVPLGTWTIEAGLPALLDALAAGFKYLDKVLNAAGPIFEAVWDDFLHPLAEWTGDAVVTALDAVSEGFTNLAENIDHSSESTAQRIIDHADMAARGTDSNFIQPTREEMQATADLIGQAFADAGSWIVDKWGEVSSWLSENVAQPTMEVFTWACEEISTAFDNAKQRLIEAWGSVVTWVDDNVTKPIQELFSDIEETVSSVWDSIVKNTLGVWQEIENAVAKAIQKIQSWINSLTGKTVYANVKVNSSGGSGGGNANESISPYSLRSTAVEAEVPYLATGAVIPPNSPFVAVLGDQRHGTNIEAPLATIQEAVRSEMGGMMAGFEAVVAEVAALRETVEGIEIGDTVIGEAVARYQKYINMLRGGTT